MRILVVSLMKSKQRNWNLHTLTLSLALSRTLNSKVTQKRITQYASANRINCVEWRKLENAIKCSNVLFFVCSISEWNSSWKTDKWIARRSQCRKIEIIKSYCSDFKPLHIYSPSKQKSLFPLQWLSTVDILKMMMPSNPGWKVLYKEIR